MAFRKNTDDALERGERVPLLKEGAFLILFGILVSAAIILTLTLYAKLGTADSVTGSNQRLDRRGMVLIPAGEFVMGNDQAHEDEAPLHKVKINMFYLDEHEVTNSEFSEFVNVTGYVTQAERDGHCWAFFQGESDWRYAAGMDWRHPQGPDSTIEDKPGHPVVCVSWADATVYAKWAGKRLPTEAEWEYAARAGSNRHFIARINGMDNSHSHSNGLVHAIAESDRSPSSKIHAQETKQRIPANFDNEIPFRANVWDGHWPENNRLGDGFYYTGPVGSFAANGMRMYDMLGNVWEWTADWYDPAYYGVSPISNPQGPATGKKRVARGGSWFCSPNYCGAYSSHYRGASPPDHAFNNVGFRCAMDISEQKK